LARGRIIDKQIHLNEQLAACSIQARYLYKAMIIHADDAGRMKASPMYLKGLIFPFDEATRAQTIKAWRDELVATGIITVYAAGGQEFLSHPNWEKFQTLRKDRIKPSDCPTPTPESSSVVDSCRTDVNQVSDSCHPEPNRTQPNRTEPKPPLPPKGEGFDVFWQAYPKKAGKEVAYKAWVKLSPSPTMIETLIAAVAKQKISDQWRKDGGQFIPHPSTWLNQKRWQDELPTNIGSDGAWLYEQRKKQGRCTACGTMLKITDGIKTCSTCDKPSIPMPRQPLPAVNLEKIPCEYHGQKIYVKDDKKHCFYCRENL